MKTLAELTKWLQDPANREHPQLGKIINTGIQIIIGEKFLHKHSLVDFHKELIQERVKVLELPEALSKEVAEKLHKEEYKSFLNECKDRLSADEYDAEKEEWYCPQDLALLKQLKESWAKIDQMIEGKTVVVNYEKSEREVLGNLESLLKDLNIHCN